MGQFRDVRGGCGRKGGAGAERDQREALGRSRGSFGAKAVVLADSHSRAVGFVLAPGQAHAAPLAPTLLGMVPGGHRWVLADKGHSFGALRAQVWDRGARPAIPAKRNEASVRCPDFIDRHRNEVERLWGRLKEWRAVATRYNKLAQSFMAVLCLAATMDRIKP